jgi:YHS domain-containing protein
MTHAMRAATEPRALIDPVCGAPVGLDSLYRRAHGGALFCFCSARCLDQFALDPARFVALTAPSGRSEASGVTRGVDEASAFAARGPGSLPANAAPDTFFPTITQSLEDNPRPAGAGAGLGSSLRSGSASIGAARRRLPVTLSGVLPGSGLLDFLAGLFPWRERRFARRVSRELLKLYRIVAAGHPGLHGRDLYRKIVIARTRADPEAAEALIDQAEESFAAWPVPRALTFCDVVHLIAVSEFLRSHGNSPWIHVNVGHEVASQIPHNL